MKLLLAATALMFSDGLPAKSPAAAGMSASRLAKIDHVVERGLAAGGFPGASVVVGRKGFAVWEKGFGRLGWTPSSGYVIPDRTIYDIASLTKVVATTTAIMLLHDEGKVRLEDPVSRFLPGFSGGSKDRVTVHQLLTHRSGLPAGRDIWRIARTPDAAREAVIASALTAEPGSRYEYSDLGADILAFVAEAAAGERLDRYLQRRVFTPLGMTDTDFRPAGSLRGRIAPTELTPPRGYPIRGEVHDENAFVLGGIANSVHNVAVRTMLQKEAPPGQHGKVAAIYSAAMGVEKVDTNRNFFDLCYLACTELGVTCQWRMDDRPYSDLHLERS